MIGRENIYTIYAKRFPDPAHLDTIVTGAWRIVANALA